MDKPYPIPIPNTILNNKPSFSSSSFPYISTNINCKTKCGVYDLVKQLVSNRGGLGSIPIEYNKDNDHKNTFNVHISTNYHIKHTDTKEENKLSNKRTLEDVYCDTIPLKKRKHIHNTYIHITNTKNQCKIDTITSPNTILTIDVDLSSSSNITNNTDIMMKHEKPKKKQRIQSIQRILYKINTYNEYMIKPKGHKPSKIVYLVDYHINDKNKVIWTVEDKKHGKNIWDEYQDHIKPHKITH